MLNKAERYRILKSYRILSIVGLHPVQVDLVSWKLTGPSRRKRWICFLFLAVLVFHALYKNGTLAYAYFFDPNVQLHQLVIHAVMAMGYVMSVIFYVILYMSESDLFAAYVTMTLLGIVGGRLVDETDGSRKQWTRRLVEYSMQDWIALGLPYVVIVIVPLIISACVYDPSMRLLLFVAIPTCLQHWTTFRLVLLEEARVLVTTVTIMIPVLQLQAISFDLICHQLHLLIRKIQDGDHGMRSAYMFLRRLQLYISVLNMDVTKAQGHNYCP